LDAARLERAWNTASFLNAALTFGPLAVWVHFARTRANVAGFVLGLALCAFAGALIAGGAELCHLLVGWLAGGNPP
jgi:hypothetical protein